jgi:hypothetical protein
MAEGVVYSDFDEGNLTDDDPDPDHTIELAFDDGYVDPRVFLFIQRTGARVLVFDEIYHSGHIESVCVGELVDRINAWPWAMPEGYDREKFLAEVEKGKRRILPDIAVGQPGAKTLQTLLRKADIPVRGKKVTHKIVEGIPVVRALICDGQGVRTLQVNRRCTNFIGELTGGYLYPETGTRVDTEKPLDKDNHGPDAIRYWAWVRARGMVNEPN